ncbi:carbohydrate ABC transporter permease [uncultured Cohaesibacter sp.]|uniref:carbohydrate ABC transporter permease n=1 Tax=uncultured Cohaesibacter sp. TaxID=1002546 RepID=UPI0029C72871|nr:carbohydrate ABC transporter permease [uncultured Cohaesibacter sp.]
MKDDLFNWRAALRIMFLLIMTALVLGPLMITVFGGFKTLGELRVSPIGLPQTWEFGNYAGILASADFWRYLKNSLTISLSCVALILIISGMAAYCFAQLHFFGKKMLFAYFTVGMMFPFATAILPLFIKIRDLNLLDSPAGVILPQVAFGLAFSMMLLRGFFEQLPKELFEAAQIDGIGYMGFFFRFTLPLSVPILSTVATFVFVQSWNNFLLSLVVLNEQHSYTWTLGMMQYRGAYMTDWSRVLAFVTLTMSPAVIFFFAAQKYIVAGLTGGAVKG